ncbi:MAG: thioredoxin family protein [Candidatus Bathyarchaeia archaeon]|jgi:thiol-disulfide isomerase/thioredoxin
MLEVKNKADLTKQLQGNKRVLALFSSSWCPFCQRFAKTFNANVSNCKVDLVLLVNMDDYNSPLWDDYAVDVVPTLILFENTEIKSRLDAGSGTGLTEKQFTTWLKTINTQ